MRRGGRAIEINKNNPPQIKKMTTTKKLLKIKGKALPQVFGIDSIIFLYDPLNLRSIEYKESVVKPFASAAQWQVFSVNVEKYMGDILKCFGRGIVTGHVPPICILCRHQGQVSTCSWYLSIDDLFRAGHDFFGGSPDRALGSAGRVAADGGH